MNPLHWLEQHPNAALVAVVGGSVLLLFFAAWLIHYYVIDVRYWFVRPRNRDDGHLWWDERGGHLTPAADEWDVDWQAEPYTDADADQLIATWHGEPLERTVPADVWDEWWAGLDGLDRELILVRHAREREERLWAELVAETREMCAA